jgi:hypothetical protein
MTHNLISIDKRFPESTAIDTEAWLERVLGSEVLSGGELEETISNKWLMQAEDDILQAIEDEEGVPYKFTQVDNVYNNENDFSSVFQWQVFYPEDASDWLYSDNVYVAIEVHQGGDVRGNYGRVRLYKVDCLAETGFFDWCLGWSVNYADGTEVAENDRFSIGYASHPFYEMQEHLKDGWKAKIYWSEKRDCFVSTYQDGRYVELHPNLYV